MLFNFYAVIEEHKKALPELQFYLLPNVQATDQNTNNVRPTATLIDDHHEYLWYFIQDQALVRQFDFEA